MGRGAEVGESSDAATPRTAVLLDRHPLWLDAVEAVVERADVVVVGKTTQPAVALQMIDEHRADVFITGIELSDAELDGMGCVREARERHPQLRVVVLSARDEQDQIEAAFEAGAVAYVMKNAHPDDLASAVRQAFEHSVYLPGFPAARAHAATPPSTDLPGLTRREREILRLVAEGYSNAKLAKMLWVTEQTVKFHLSNIYRKLNVPNRTGAARWAQVHGLLAESDQEQLVA